MAVDVVNDSKNLVTVANDSKNAAALVTIGEYDDTWAEAEGTWETPHTPMQTGASKNMATITNDSKS